MTSPECLYYLEMGTERSVSLKPNVMLLGEREAFVLSDRAPAFS